ncbi:MAG TPA: PHP-associated domain-containing protein [Candidatus Limnocylindria bacterium]|nr:PHP-associated domain-containing protein [Candidatus Limnocylindria bacterium]
MDRSPSAGDRGKADLHLHTLYSDGTARLVDLLDWIEHRTDLDLVAITDHDRIDGATRAAAMHAAGDYRFQFVIGEEITTRSGHVVGLFLEERIPPFRSVAETIERIHAQGGLAVAAHPLGVFLSLGSGSLLRLQSDPNPQRHLDAVELINPSLGGRLRHGALARLNAERLHLPGMGNSDAHVLETVASAWTWFPGSSADDFRAALDAGLVEPGGSHWSTGHNVAVYGRQLMAKARKLGHTLRPSGEWR